MSSKGLKIIFMGSPDFACPTLEALLQSRHDVCHVLTQPPRAAGRGMAETKTAIARCAMDHHIQTSWPNSLADDEVKHRLASMRPDLFVVVAYGLILPVDILTIPSYGSVNGHASLLPRWRGAAPIQRAIESGDPITGTCAMMMEEGLDTGPVIAKMETDISAQDTAQTLHDRLAQMTAQTLLLAIDKIADGTAKPVPQSENGITYAAKIHKSEAALDLTRPAQSLKQQIHAFSPFPGSFIKGQSGTRLKCLTASTSAMTHDKMAGTYLGQDEDSALLLACGEGTVLCLHSLQPSGKKPMTSAEFIRGRKLTINASLDSQI